MSSNDYHLRSVVPIFTSCCHRNEPLSLFPLRSFSCRFRLGECISHSFCSVNLALSHDWSVVTFVGVVFSMSLRCCNFFTMLWRAYFAYFFNHIFARNSCFFPVIQNSMFTFRYWRIKQFQFRALCFKLQKLTEHKTLNFKTVKLFKLLNLMYMKYASSDCKVHDASCTMIKISRNVNSSFATNHVSSFTKYDNIMVPCITFCGICAHVISDLVVKSSIHFSSYNVLTSTSVWLQYLWLWN